MHSRWIYCMVIFTSCNSYFVEICVIVTFGFPEHLKTKEEVEMSKLIDDSIPISPFCQYAIGSERSSWRFLVWCTVIIVSIAWYFLSSFVAVLVAIILASALWRAVRPGFKHNEDMWLEINKKDHEVSMQVEDILKTYYHYSEQNIYDAGVAEDRIDSLWTPVYAQYFSGARGLSGDVSVSGIMGGLFGTNGTLSGKVTGSVGPDSLADLGAVIVMQNENGQSIRVVVPHRQVAEQMFAEALRSFNSDENNLRTLTSLRIYRLSALLPAKACVVVTSALGVMDQIIGSIGKPLEERVTVTVYGKEVSPGVIMATALEAGGSRGVFIPTGYFKEVTDKLSEFLGAYRGDVAMLLDGQGPFASKEGQPVV